jgi:CheY-specific phosphatase CheX
VTTPTGVASPVERTSRLKIPVRALVIASPSGLRERLIMDLGARGFVTDAMTPAGANPFGAIVDPRVGALIVDLDELSERGIQSLARLAYDRPDLQIGVVGRPRSESIGFTLRPGLVVSRPDETATLAARLFAGLPPHNYELLATVLHEATSAVLSETQIAIEPMPPIVRFSQTMPGRLGASIDVTGDISARVTVSTDARLFENIAREWLGSRPPSKRGVWDAAGEVSNRVAGLVRNELLRFGLETSQSTPTILEGDGVTVRAMTERPSLLAAFRVERLPAPLFVELVLACDLPSTRCAPDEGEDMAQPGEISFL